MSDDDVRRQVFQDFGERTTTFKLTQDAEPILERNKQLRSEPQKSEWMRHTASIPATLIAKWLHEVWAAGGTHITFGSKEFEELIRRKLDDPDYRFLRTDAPPPAYRR